MFFIFFFLFNDQIVLIECFAIAKFRIFGKVFKKFVCSGYESKCLEIF